MQTSQTGTYNKISNFKFQISNFRRAGFTIIELVVVIVIISIFMAFVMPSFWNSDKTELKTEAKFLSSTLRYIYDEAVGKKQKYILSIDFDNKTWGFESDSESKKFNIKDDVIIKDIVVPSLGEVSKGEVILEFGPTGPPEPITLHLQKSASEYTIIFNHLSGRTKILEGYIL